jgi:hypothetical protein
MVVAVMVGGVGFSTGVVVHPGVCKLLLGVTFCLASLLCLNIGKP